MLTAEYQQDAAVSLWILITIRVRRRWVELFRLTLRFFDDVWSFRRRRNLFFSIPTSNFSTTRRNFQSLLYYGCFSLFKVHVSFSSSLVSIGTMAVVRSSTVFIGVAGGAMGAPAPPGCRNFVRRNLQWKFVSAPQHTKCTPRQSKDQSLRHIFAVRRRFGGSISSFIGLQSFEGTTKKVVNFF